MALSKENGLVAALEIPQQPPVAPPLREHDACGHEIMVNANGIPDRQLVDDMLATMRRLDLRVGSVPDGDREMGDGAGVVLDAPDAWYQYELTKKGIQVDLCPGQYVPVHMALSQDPSLREAERSQVEDILAAQGFKIVGWVDDIIDSDIQTPTAKAQAPFRTHAIAVPVEGQGKLSKQELDNRVLKIGNALEMGLPQGDRTPYYTSAYLNKVNWKASVLPSEIEGLFPILQAPEKRKDKFREAFKKEDGSSFVYTSSFGQGHGRFSTGTRPSARRAQPTAKAGAPISTNGDQVSADKNADQMIALEREIFGNKDYRVDGDANDAHQLGHMIASLTEQGYSIDEAIFIVSQPVIKQDDPGYSQEIKDMVQWWGQIFTTSAGPMALLFSGNDIIAGGKKDSQGFRPLDLIERERVNEKGEKVRVLHIASENPYSQGVLHQEAIGAGEMLTIERQDDGSVKIVRNKEILERLARRKISIKGEDGEVREVSYGEALKAQVYELPKKLPTLPLAELNPLSLDLQMQVHGWGSEEVERIVEFGRTAKSKTMAMGNDVPEIGSGRMKQSTEYFKPDGNQIINPTCDIEREHMNATTAVYGGAHPSIPGALRIRHADPILTPEQIIEVKQRFQKKAVELPMVFEAKKGGLQAALKELAEKAETAVRNGAQAIILEDYMTNKALAPIPSMEAVRVIYRRLQQKGLSLKASIYVNADGISTGFDHTALMAAGATAVCAHNAYRVLWERAQLPGEKTYEQLRDNYHKGVLDSHMADIAKRGFNDSKLVIGAGGAFLLSTELKLNYLEGDFVKKRNDFLDVLAAHIVDSWPHKSDPAAIKAAIIKSFFQNGGNAAKYYKKDDRGVVTLTPEGLDLSQGIASREYSSEEELIQAISHHRQRIEDWETTLPHLYHDVYRPQMGIRQGPVAIYDIDGIEKRILQQHARAMGLADPGFLPDHGRSAPDSFGERHLHNPTESELRAKWVAAEQMATFLKAHRGIREQKVSVVAKQDVVNQLPKEQDGPPNFSTTRFKPKPLGTKQERTKEEKQAIQGQLSTALEQSRQVWRRAMVREVMAKDQDVAGFVKERGLLGPEKFMDSSGQLMAEELSGDLTRYHEHQQAVNAHYNAMTKIREGNIQLTPPSSDPVAAIRPLSIIEPSSPRTFESQDRAFSADDEPLSRYGYGSPEIGMHTPVQGHTRSAASVFSGTSVGSAIEPSTIKLPPKKQKVIPNGDVGSATQLPGYRVFEESVKLHMATRKRVVKEFSSVPVDYQDYGKIRPGVDHSDGGLYRRYIEDGYSPLAKSAKPVEKQKADTDKSYAFLGAWPWIKPQDIGGLEGSEILLAHYLPLVGDDEEDYVILQHSKKLYHDVVQAVKERSDKYNLLFEMLKAHEPYKQWLIKHRWYGKTEETNLSVVHENPFEALGNLDKEAVTIFSQWLAQKEKGLTERISRGVAGLPMIDGRLRKDDIDNWQVSEAFKIFMEKLKAHREGEPILLSHHMHLGTDHDPIPVDGVQSISSLLQQNLSLDHISLGALTSIAHFYRNRAAIAVGMKSGDGEGGNRLTIYRKDIDEKNLHEIQSSGGQFGLDNLAAKLAEIFNVKIGQIAKRHTGGNIPNKKNRLWMALVRRLTPGQEVGSPRILHMLYSIEDSASLALMYHMIDLDTQKEVIFKITSNDNAATVASGAAKFHVDQVDIAGGPGGTASAKWEDWMQNLSWVRALIETQDALSENGLRGNDRETLTRIGISGGFTTTDDEMVAHALGADQVRIGTNAMKLQNCNMQRQCHKAMELTVDDEGNIEVKDGGCSYGVANMASKFKLNPGIAEAYYLNDAALKRQRLANMGMVAVAPDGIPEGTPQELRGRTLRGRRDLITMKFPEQLVSEYGIPDIGDLLQPSPPNKPTPYDLKKQRQEKDRKERKDWRLLERIKRDIEADPLKKRVYSYKDPEIGGLLKIDTEHDVGWGACIGAALADVLVPKKAGQVLRPGQVAVDKDHITLEIDSSEGIPQRAFSFMGHGVTVKVRGQGAAQDTMGGNLSGAEILFSAPERGEHSAAHEKLVGNTMAMGATGGTIVVDGNLTMRNLVVAHGGNYVARGAGDFLGEYSDNLSVTIMGDINGGQESGNIGRGIGAGSPGSIFAIYAPDAKALEAKLDDTSMELLSQEAKQPYKQAVYQMIERLAEAGSSDARTALERWDEVFQHFQIAVPKPLLLIERDLSSTDKEKRQAALKLLQLIEKVDVLQEGETSIYRQVWLSLIQQHPAYRRALEEQVKKKRVIFSEPGQVSPGVSDIKVDPLVVSVLAAAQQCKDTCRTCTGPSGCPVERQIPEAAKKLDELYDMIGKRLAREGILPQKPSYRAVPGAIQDIEDIVRDEDPKKTLRLGQKAREKKERDQIIKSAIVEKRLTGAEQEQLRRFVLFMAAGSHDLSTGKICPAPCESACADKGNEDAQSEAVQIKRLEEEAYLYDEVYNILGEHCRNPADNPAAPPRKPLKVVVVGAGPAGKEFARHASEMVDDPLDPRKHVTIFEQSKAPEGDGAFGAIPAKKGVAKNADKDRHRLEGKGVCIEYGATLPQVSSAIAAADITVLAVGNSQTPIWLDIKVNIPRTDGSAEEMTLERAVKGGYLRGVHQAIESLWASNASAREEGRANPYSLVDKRLAVVGAGFTSDDELNNFKDQNPSRGGASGRASVTSIERSRLPGRNSSIGVISPAPSDALHPERRKVLSKTQAIQYGLSDIVALRTINAVADNGLVEKDGYVVQQLTGARVRENRLEEAYRERLPKGQSGAKVFRGEHEVPLDVLSLALGFAGPAGILNQDGTRSGGNPLLHQLLDQWREQGYMPQVDDRGYLKTINHMVVGVPGVMIVGDACNEPLPHTGKSEKRADIVVASLRDGRNAAASLSDCLQLMGTPDYRDVLTDTVLWNQMAVSLGPSTSLAVSAQGVSAQYPAAASLANVA